jgi:hypothetical protein
MKLSRHQIIQVFRTRGEDKGQAVDDGIDQACRTNSRVVVVVASGHGQVLSKYEGEVEGKLFVIRQA